MFNEDAKQIAMEARKLMQQFTKEFENEFYKFMATVKPFDYNDPILWKFVAELSKQLKYHSPEASCHNVFCYWKNEEMLEAIRAVVTIGKIKMALYHPLFNVIKDRGDDGYGDFIDAFFLAGPKVVGKALERKYHDGDESSIRKEVLESCGDHIAKLIWNGENYFLSKLEESAQNWFKYAENPPQLVGEEEKSSIWYENVE